MAALTSKLTPLAARAKRLSALFLAIMILGSIGLDQVTKLDAQDRLMRWSDAKDPSIYQGQRYPIYAAGSPIANDGTKFYFALGTNYVRNMGAAWGALSTLPNSVRVPFFYMVTVMAVIIIVVYMRSTPVNHRLAIFALAMILSGAVGNFIDRIRLGFVIDWIDVRWNLFGWRYDFPNFNFADSMITVGVSLLLVDMLILDHLRKRQRQVVAAAAA